MKRLTKINILAVLFIFGALNFTKSFAQPPGAGGEAAITGIVFLDVEKFQAGDEIKAYYMLNDTAYEIGSVAISEGYKGFIISAENQTETPLNGAPFNSDIHLAAKTDTGTYKLNLLDVTDSYNRPYTLKARGLELVNVNEVLITDERVLLHPVPWLAYFASLCPIISFDIPKIKDPYSGQAIRLPVGVYYAQGYSIEVVKGTGKTFRDGLFHNYYKIGAGDLDLDEIQLKIKANPKPGCLEDDVFDVMTIPIERTATEEANYETLSLRAWQIYMKYYFDVKLEGNTVTAFYINKEREKRGWGDRKLPALNIKVTYKTSRYTPRSKIIGERKTYVDYPNEVFEIPEGWAYILVEVTSIYHGHRLIFRFYE